MSTMSIDRSRRPHDRTRTRTQFRLEGLEERCLMSGISSITEFPLSSSPAALSAITTGPDGNVWFTDRGGNAIGERSTRPPMPFLCTPSPPRAPGHTES
jgi:hypothetical protein